ncbi:hypothetical protein [Flavobacterium reichenbachii]|uniref:Uncharacterized protein n=1 Tax=Flavobacterium reichenbachii TaxID=362418 RepID=A0A085ZJP3_9FLAO|nr:hypothetical protein [Flavobacterium reichenbachii]KFF04657.1 hypothetical protein IW19_03515 [Flavobacterium reichenbachii]OXB09852.1 hypothetical protein B0A68_23205 [Flavobacterium reichenbachii]
MNSKLPLFLFLLLSTFANAQETITINGSKPFPATQKYTFICEKYAFTGETNVQIAKTDKGGVLKLTIATANDKARIAGGLYVDLANGDVIACLDKNVKESAAGTTTSYYYFTPAEFLKLKKTDVYAIRFIIAGGPNTFGSQTGYFTTYNKMNYFSTAYDKSKKSYDTAKEISIL